MVGREGIPVARFLRRLEGSVELVAVEFIAGDWVAELESNVMRMLVMPSVPLVTNISVPFLAKVRFPFQRERLIARSRIEVPRSSSVALVFTRLPMEMWTIDEGELLGCQDQKRGVASSDGITSISTVARR